MITFLWVLYLALTLFCTIKTIYWLIAYIIGKSNDQIIIQIGIILISILWSIWYFYYLN